MTLDEIRRLVDEHTSRIGSVIPDAEVRLSGSTLLGELGGHDIDLVVLVADVRDAAARLRPVYPPLYEDEWRPDWAAFRVVGPPQVDLVVTSPGTVGDAHHRRAWELLLSDHGLREEYEALRSAGMSSEQKRVFFKHVVSLLPD
jgi:hypothetical protein